MELNDPQAHELIELAMEADKAAARAEAAADRLEKAEAKSAATLEAIDRLVAGDAKVRVTRLPHRSAVTLQVGLVIEDHEAAALMPKLIRDRLLEVAPKAVEAFMDNKDPMRRIRGEIHQNDWWAAKVLDSREQTKITGELLDGLRKAIRDPLADMENSKPAESWLTPDELREVQKKLAEPLLTPVRAKWFWPDPFGDPEARRHFR